MSRRFLAGSSLGFAFSILLPLSLKAQVGPTQRTNSLWQTTTTPKVVAPTTISVNGVADIDPAKAFGSKNRPHRHRNLQ